MMKNEAPNRVQFFLLIIVSMLFIQATVVANGTEDRFKMSGDFRLRNEFNTNRDGDKPDRLRERLRFRTNLQLQINEYLTVYSRLTTGNPADPNSPHRTFGSMFHREAFSVDRAYAQFSYKDLWIKGGKFGRPFKSSGVYGELLWDGDIQPEGFSAGYDLKAGDSLNVSLIGAEYILLEQSNSGDASLGAGQIALNLTQKPVSVIAAGSIYKYVKLNAEDLGLDGLQRIIADNEGNATVDVDEDGDGESDGKAFVSNFTIVDAFVNVTYNTEIAGKSQPIILSGQFFKNLDAEIDQDTGFAAGVRIGNTQAKKDFKVYYSYVLVEQDALFSAFAQDDFMAQTNFKGHVFGVTYRLLDKTDLNLWGLLSKKDTLQEGEEVGFQTRLRADVNIGF